jgi:hypothetical protein
VQRGHPFRMPVSVRQASINSIACISFSGGIGGRLIDECYKRNAHFIHPKSDCNAHERTWSSGKRGGNLW